MANTTIEELLNLAYEVRDADQAGENTALRVGGLLEEIIQYLTTVVDLTTLQAIMEQYATLSGTGGLIYWRHSRIICLASMGYDLDNIDGGNWNYTDHNGDIVFRPSSAGGGLRVVGTTDDYSVFSNVVYVNNHTGHAYIWKQVGSTFKMVEIRDSSTTTIITYFNTPTFSQVEIGESYYYSSGNNRKIAIKISSDETYSFDPDPKKIYVFLDTRQAMVWDAGNRQWISVGGGNVDVINNLTSTYTDKPLSAKMGRDLLLLIQQIYSSLGHAAFWAEKPEIDWESVGFTMYTITRQYGTHVNAGPSIPKVVEDSEYNEEITFESGYAKLAISVTMGGTDITSTAVTGNSIHIAAVTGPVVITATAQQMLAVTYNGLVNCSTDSSDGAAPTMVAPGGTLTFKLKATNGYELPASVSYGTNSTASISNCVVTIQNVTEAINISATAVAISQPFIEKDANNNDIRYGLESNNVDVFVTVMSGEQSESGANTGDKYTGDIVIPATVKHHGAIYNVKKVGHYAFKSCTGVTSLTFLGGLVFEWHAFNGCGAASINWNDSADYSLIKNPSSNTSYAFNGMNNLTSITFPNKFVNSGMQTLLQSCHSLSYIKLGTGWTSLGSYTMKDFRPVAQGGCVLDIGTGICVANSYHQEAGLNANTTGDATIVTVIIRATDGVMKRSGNLNPTTIYVPRDLVDDYEAESCWATQAANNKILSIEDDYVEPSAS